MPFWTYMLHCADRTFYVGHTDDLERRVGQHELGLVPGYTESRRPVKLVWCQEFADRNEAREAERQLKGWGQAKKRALIRGDCALIARLAKGKETASTSSAKPGFGEASVFLHPHPDHLPSEAFALEGRVRLTEEALHLRYRLTGPIDCLAIPSPARGCRAAELWQHTCFEAFIQTGPPSYVEINVSPSRNWAAYSFDGYRAGMAELPGEPLDIKVRQERYALTLAASFALPRAVEPARLNLAVILEEKSGRKSYWALRHPPGDPDFHHPDCFALELPAAEANPSPRT